MIERFDIAGYCRISVDEELDRDNTSIENQKAITTRSSSCTTKGFGRSFSTSSSGYGFSCSKMCIRDRLKVCLELA